MVNYKAFPIIVAIVFSLLFPFCAIARTYSGVSLIVENANGTIKVSKYTEASEYSIGSTEVRNGVLTIKINAGSGNDFKKDLTKNDISLQSGSTYSKNDIASVSVSGSTLTIKMNVGEDDSESEKESSSSGSKSSSSDSRSGSDLTVSDVRLSAASGKASWSGSADEYTVRLLHDGVVLKSSSTKNESYDFSGSFTGGGSYYVRVRAESGSDYGEWERSESVSLSSEEAEAINAGASLTNNSGYEDNNGQNYSPSPAPGGVTSQGAWLQDVNGWWYCNADRSYTVNNWQFINDKWYFFDEHGYMKTGWIIWGDKWYYLNPTGEMLTSAWTPDDWYVDSSGVWDQSIGHKTVQ